VKLGILGSVAEGAASVTVCGVGRSCQTRLADRLSEVNPLHPSDQSRTDRRRSCAAAPCCFIAPPDLLARLAEEGTAEEREAAIRTLAASASIRTRRSILGPLIRDMGVAGVPPGFLAPQTGQLHTVYDVEHQGRSALPGRKVRGIDDPESSDDAVNEAFDGSKKTYDFYNEVFERNSVDGNGLELVSSVHYGVDFDNAFWNGNQMIYGDGSGRIFAVGHLTKALDVIGHELTHGVTQFTAGLEYSKQSGALNESISDVFGSLVKQYSLQQTAAEADWLIGQGTLVPALGGALRSMKEPGTAFNGDPQPGHMRDYKDLPDDNNPRNDNGGVHINSGIPNRAFFLVADAIGGHAWEKAGRIWYLTLTERLQPDSQFVDAANATIAVAGELFSEGGSEQEAVQRAWQEVGVL
jgi:Zn-dependent metalloprotease